MKFIHPVFLVSLLICVRSYGQNQVTDTSATIVAYWHKDDVVNYSIEKIKSKLGDDNAPVQSTSYSVRILVVEETDKSYTLEWTSSGLITKGQPVDDQLMEKIGNATGQVKLLYKTDELGSFTELLNWKEIREQFRKSFDILLNEFDKEKRKQVKPVLDELSGIFETKEGIENFVLKDVQLFHAPYGGEYVLNDSLSGEAFLPNPIGGDPFPARLSVILSDINREKQTCTLIITQSIDKEKASTIIYDFVKKLFQASGATVTDEEMPEIDISDYNEFEVDLNSGWMNRVNFKRTVSAGERGNVEEYRIIRK